MSGAATGTPGAGAPGTDVLVVGYGPVGQVTATLLAAKGHRVTVVERWPRPYPMPRAVSFDGESARILAAAGIGDSLPVVGEPSRDYVWVNGEGRTLFEVDVADPGWSGWPDSVSMYQPGIEAALAERGARQATLRVLRGHRAVGLRDTGDRVEVAVDGPEGGVLSARYVVGCDGANSFVREAAGVTATDLRFFNDWLTCDVTPHEPRAFAPNNLQVCDPARPRTAVSAGPGHRRWEFMRLPGESPEEFGTAENAWRLLALFGIDKGNATLERHAVYTFQARYTDQWRIGRVLLAGDAAHLMPPFAGQGMCSGFRDAANLAWKLDLVLTGRAAEALLDTYTAERRAHVRHAITMSTSLGRVICQTDPAAARDRDDVMIGVRERGLAAAQPSAVHPLTEGLLDRDADGGPRAPAGELAPQGRVRLEGREGLFDDVVGPGFVLLTTEPPGELLDPVHTAALERLGTRIVRLDGACDLDGVYLPYLARTGAVAALVRPDFYLFGAAGDRSGTLALVRALLDGLGAGLRPGTDPGSEPGTGTGGVVSRSS
ncbi:bifunctional 3-(3-hydroxy-phenyl)propionate/3-hydroxycinnamic acid hydroxylase [Spirillospora sp. CA-255316]